MSDCPDVRTPDQINADRSCRRWWRRSCDDFLTAGWSQLAPQASGAKACTAHRWRIAGRLVLSHAVSVTIGSWGWARRLGFLSLGLGFVLGALGACAGAAANSEPPHELSVQQPDGRALEPVAEASDPKPKRESELERTPKLTLASPEGLSAASCAAFDSAQLVAVAADENCDSETPETCPEGTHIDWVPGSPCASCVADSPENRTCAWATACFEPFIESIAHASGAKSCKRDGDCAVLTVSAGCGPKLSMALKASLDEEMPMIASLYAEQNCNLCPDAPGSASDFAKTHPRCVDGVCR